MCQDGRYNYAILASLRPTSSSVTHRSSALHVTCTVQHIASNYTWRWTRRVWHLHQSCQTKVGISTIHVDDNSGLTAHYGLTAHWIYIPVDIKPSNFHNLTKTCQIFPQNCFPIWPSKNTSTLLPNFLATVQSQGSYFPVCNPIPGL